MRYYQYVVPMGLGLLPLCRPLGLAESITFEASAVRHGILVEKNIYNNPKSRRDEIIVVQFE